LDGLYCSYFFIQREVIDESTDFTDFASVPADMITVAVKFTDGTIQTKTVTMAFSEDGSVTSILSGD